MKRLNLKFKSKLKFFNLWDSFQFMTFSTPTKIPTPDEYLNTIRLTWFLKPPPLKQIISKVVT